MSTVTVDYENIILAMTYKDTPHPHQSEYLSFLPPDYLPLSLAYGVLRFGVITLLRDVLYVAYQETLPQFGGYIAKESIYGNPQYCPNATKQHKKHMDLYGVMPHLVFFDSSEAAVTAGFRACQRCLGESTLALG